MIEWKFVIASAKLAVRARDRVRCKMVNMGKGHSFIDCESGQGITEYGAILAFVALLIVLMLGFTTGSVGSALQNCFSTIISTIDNLNSQI